MAGKIGSKLVTEPQMRLLELLAKQNGFDGADDALRANNIKLRNWKYELETVDASLTIDALKSRKLIYEAPEPEVEPEVVSDSAPNALDVLALIGRKVRVQTAKTFEGRITGLTTRTKDGSLGLTLDTYHAAIRFSVIKELSLIDAGTTVAEVQATVSASRQQLADERARLVERLAGIDALLDVSFI
jgi:hypothetical protein